MTEVHMLVDAKKTKEEIAQWIRDYFSNNGPKCAAVVGISGGKDSSIVAALCAEALGADRVVGVMMPNGVQSDIKDSLRIIDALGIQSFTFNIRTAMEAMVLEFRSSMDMRDQTKVNLPARIRMAALYAFAQSLPTGGRVANTCNLSEDYVGYSTKFGDSAGDFSPLANLMVNEVLEIGYELQIPRDLVDKTPADGLCGKVDEDNLGFTYAQLDDYITNGTCGITAIDHKIAVMHKQNMHKLSPMPSFRKHQ